MSMVPMMEIMVNKIGIPSVLLAKYGYIEWHNAKQQPAVFSHSTENFERIHVNASILFDK